MTNYPIPQSTLRHARRNRRCFPNGHLHGLVCGDQPALRTWRRAIAGPAVKLGIDKTGILQHGQERHAPDCTGDSP